MKVGVYGLGRFGSFWATVLSRKFDVLGFSRSRDRVVPEGVLRATEDEVLACDAVFLAVAISAMDEVASMIAPRLRPNSLIFDTCSVKVHPIAVMQKYFPQSVEIIGTHPMFGPDSGKRGVTGLPIVYCPVRVSDEHDRFWRDAFGSLGLSVKDLTPDAHDREAAYTQGVTHFIGRVLQDLSLKPSTISTIGYAKLLEIIEQTCNDPWQLFLDLQHYNPYTAPMRVELYTSLAKIKSKLESSIGPEPSTIDRETGKQGDS
ncbi:MAG TPA: prephenate dehydrogenase/arogenate dehydrogenase family protein [Spirochaetia bacterium]|nr:prephenate dehydrogenase/arogenate dehydrogenase family protein [Spirochaetia bacterium]